VRRDLGALAGREHDLLVVGGGIYGAMAAWDAAQRGLAVALVEAADFGSGASWNSLKTIHGGLRDLQRLDLPQVRDSVRERRAFLRIAPALVRPLPFVVPAYGHGPRGRESLGLGLLLYDALARDRNDGLPPESRLPASRLLSRGDVLHLFPALPPRGLNGGALWTDAQVESSERLLMAVLHDAAGHGAAIANRAEVTGLRVVGSRVDGAHVRDTEGTGSLEVRARMVLNAAGDGMAAVVQMAGIPSPPSPLVAGMNLVLRRPIVSGRALGRLAHGRFLFAVPWRDRSLVGTAYGPPDGTDPRRDAAAFLAEARQAFPWAGLEPGDVAAVHRGLVPGDERGLASRPLLIDHESRDRVAGLVSVQGVKYTAARSVAQKAVDRVCARLGRKTAPCRTATTPLDGAVPLDGPLGERTRRVVREEMALHLSDAVLRRLDLGTAGPPGPAEVETVAATMATELGWSPARRREEENALAAAPPYAAVPAAAEDRLE